MYRQNITEGIVQQLHARWRRRTFGLQAKVRYVIRLRPVWMINFAIEEASFSEGMRAAVASGLMLLLGIVFQTPLFAWGAIGAFWTCLADASGSSRSRLLSMLSFSLISTIAGGMSAWAASFGTGPAAIAIFSVSVLAGLTRTGGMAAYQVGILAATACTVMVDNPLDDFHHAFTVLGIYLLGCLGATLFGATIWRLHRFAPGRYALRLTYLRLAELAQSYILPANASVNEWQKWNRHVAELRAQCLMALDASHKALEDVSVLSKESAGQVYWNLSLALADAECIFTSLTALLVNEGDTQRPERINRCLGAIAEVLRRVGETLGKQRGGYSWRERDKLPRLSRYLEKSVKYSLPLPLPLPLPLCRDECMMTAAAWQTRSKTRNVRVGVGAVLRRYLFARPDILHHALRLGVATTAAFWLVRLLHLPYGYWATMAVLLILQPTLTMTWPRALERVTGSAIGAILAAVTGYLVHTPLAISLAVMGFICLTMSMRPVSYSLFVIFLTPSFVLVADVLSPANELLYTLVRLGNNMLGGLIAFIAVCLLWPKRARNNLQRSLLETVRAHLYALSLAAGGEAETDCHARLGREAGLAGYQTESLFTLMQREKRRWNNTHMLREIFILLRKIELTIIQFRRRRHPYSTGEFTRWLTFISENFMEIAKGDMTKNIPFLCLSQQLDDIELTALSQVNKLFYLLSDMKESML